MSPSAWRLRLPPSPTRSLLRSRRAAISKDERRAKDAADIAKRVPTAFAALPDPLSVTLAPRADDDIGAGDAPAIITVPQDDLKPLFDRLEDCRACQEQLSVAQQ